VNARAGYRIIWHEVGHALQYMDFPITADTVLRKAVIPLTRTQVDCLSWLGHTYLGGPYDMPRLWRDHLDPSPYEYVDPEGRPLGQFMEKVRPDPDRYHDEGQRRRYGTSHELWKQGIDVVDLASAAARRYGMDFTLAFRTNDCHHGSWDEHPRWWLEHRELSVGKGADSQGRVNVARAMACLDFTHAAVREHVMAPLVAACECYDIDGLDLDFSRSRPYFPAGEERPDLLTEFLRDLRARVEPAFRRRGRDVRILARIYERPLCDQSGMDWRTWLAEGLVDGIAVGRSYGADHREMVAAACTRQIPVYAAIDCIAFDLNVTKRYGRLEYFRAACLDYYHQGVAGIFFYNGSALWSGVYPGPVARAMPHLMEVGDKDCIERRDKIYVTGWHPDHKPQLVWSSDPARASDGARAVLTVADRLQDSADCGDLERVILRAEFRLVTPWINEMNAWHAIWSRLDAMEYLLNGQRIEPEPIQRDELTTDAPNATAINTNWCRVVAFDLTRGPLPTYGRNEFSVRLLAPDPQLTGPRELMLGRVEIDIRYGTPCER